MKIELKTLILIEFAEIIHAENFLGLVQSLITECMFFAFSFMTSFSATILIILDDKLIFLKKI